MKYILAIFVTSGVLWGSVSYGQKVIKPHEIRLPRKTPSPPHTQREWIEQYDKIAQSRFATEGMNVFGTSRLVVLPPKFKIKGKGLPLSQLGFAVGMYHLVPTPVAQKPHPMTLTNLPTKRNFQPHAEFLEFKAQGNLMRADAIEEKALQQWLKEVTPSVEQACKQSAKELLKGKPLEVKIPRHTLLFRPITASHKSCLSCHKESKSGDTLGVLYYVMPTAK